MSITLIDSNWNVEFHKLASQTRNSINFITPFIKKATTEALVSNGRIHIQLITRYSELDFYNGVSDLSALEYLLDLGAEIRGVHDLHSKLYVFDRKKVIITSANLTSKALRTNHELGIIASSNQVTKSALEHFDELWEKCGPNLVQTELSEWKKNVEKYTKRYGKLKRGNSLHDHGKKVDSIIIPSESTSLVKFFGSSKNRSNRDESILREVIRSGCHWAATYPKGRIPRSVSTNARIYFAGLVKGPNDIMIFGRAVGHPHKPGRDDATTREIKKRPFKGKYPHYIRTTKPELLDANLNDGVSLSALMKKFGYNSFATTLRHQLAGKGNTNPRSSYSQQASVVLTADSDKWLNQQLNRRFSMHGKIDINQNKKLDWPSNYEIYKGL